MIVATVMVLQRIEGLSDREAVDLDRGGPQERHLERVAVRVAASRYPSLGRVLRHADRRGQAAHIR